MSTIKDVARAAGVGVATASRALSGRGSVSAATLERVRRAVSELHYRPSAIAQALSLKQSGAIGMFVPSVNDSFYASTLEHVDRVVRAHGKHLIVVTGLPGLDAREQALDALEFLQGRDCDGLVFAGYELTAADLLRWRERQPHIALVNRSVARMRQQCIALDHEWGGRLAARVLLSRGHRRVALLRGREASLDNHERIAGFKAELAEHGLTVALELQGDFTRESGFAAGEALYQRIDRTRPPEQRCTALFSANDRMASGLFASLSSHGWRLPQELSVVGYDDDDMAPYASPPLTTVHIPIHQMAEAAASYLLNQCYGMTLPVERRFAAQVVWRRSVVDGPFPPLGLPPDTASAEQTSPRFSTN